MVCLAKNDTAWQELSKNSEWEHLSGLLRHAGNEPVTSAASMIFHLSTILSLFASL